MTNETKSKSIKTIEIIGLLCLGIGVFLIGFYLNKNKVAVKTEIPAGWQAEFEELQQHSYVLKDLAQQKIDTIMKLRTELALLGVEKNRSEAKVKEYAARIRQYETGKYESGQHIIWTDALEGKIRDCDSLAEELQDVYLAKATEQDALADSLNTFYGQLLDNKDSTIADCESLNKKYFADLYKAKVNEQIAESKAEKAKKAGKIGFLAAGIAGIITILSHL